METVSARTERKQEAPKLASAPLRMPGQDNLLQRKCACGGTPGVDGECAACRAKRLGVQPKLTISAPDDGYEQEAERIATAVVPGTGASAGESVPAVRKLASAITPLVQRQETNGEAKEEEKPVEEKLKETETEGVGLQRFPQTYGTTSLASPIVHETLKDTGRPLDQQTRLFMEPRFGYDFSHVRVHTDARAAESARAVNALAYTVGRDVVFGAGQYAPEGSAGQRLIAHELAHVVQQTGAPGGNQSLMLQRQFSFDCGLDPFKLARLLKGDKSMALEFLNCCQQGLGPLPKGCTADLVAAARKILGKGGGKGNTNLCPPGFKPGATKDFQGQCCKEGITAENDVDCCPSVQIAINASSPRCCPKDTIPDSEKKNCVAPPKFTLEPCAPDRSVPMGLCLCLPITRQNLKRGVCCPVGQSEVNGECEEAKPKPPPQAPFTVVKTIEIEFKKDAPQTWYDPRASFSVSVTSEGKTQFNDLVSTLAGDSELLVQLEGRASSDKPPGDGDYNRHLTDRRVQLIAAELKKMKIDSDTRVSDPPGQTNLAECEEIATGRLSCGDAGAKVPVDPKDRKVVARVFSVTKQGAP